MPEEGETEIPVIDDEERLLRLGICKVRIPASIDNEKQRWASKLAFVSPVIMAAQGDNEYPFYRNIIEDPGLEFPIESVISPEIEGNFAKYFGVGKRDVRLDDAFCVHYNMEQGVTSGAKHMDPSDITINLCLEKTNDVEGSHVLFYGSKPLQNVAEYEEKAAEFRFLVPQEKGFATIHFGDHPHETTTLLNGGKRTNVILTYCYVDKSKSDVDKRSCYFD